MLYAGIDLGTSSVKLLLMDKEGTIINTVTEEYPIYHSINDLVQFSGTVLKFKATLFSAIANS